MIPAWLNRVIMWRHYPIAMGAVAFTVSMLAGMLLPTWQFALVVVAIVGGMFALTYVVGRPS